MGEEGYSSSPNLYDFDMSLFQSTRWSLVRRARAGNNLAARAALADLFSHYWEPLYYFLRRRGQQPDDAADLVQGYFTHVLEKESLEKADPKRGRFRTFLLSSLQNYLGHEREKQRSQKRGGGRIVESLDFQRAESNYQREPLDSMTPERLFDRQYALMLVQQVMTTLQEEYAERGKATLWQAIHPALTGDQHQSYDVLAQQLKVSESAIKVAVYRLRQRFAVVLRQAVMQTLETDEAMEEEMAWLQAALRLE
jgi:RNA polymerase sigma factor (sigma-70 family)